MAKTCGFLTARLTPGAQDESPDRRAFQRRRRSAMMAENRFRQSRSTPVTRHWLSTWSLIISVTMFSIAMTGVGPLQAQQDRRPTARTAEPFPADVAVAPPPAIFNRIGVEVPHDDPGLQADARQPATPMFTPATVSTSLNMLAVVTVVGLVPSIAMMMTCFVRFTVVLGFLRQALGSPQALPAQVITALGLFMTFLVMAPVWQRSYDEGIRPFVQPAAGAAALDEAAAFRRTAAPVRQFMARQIDRAGNADAVWMLIDYQRPDSGSTAMATWREPQSYDDVPLTVLIPAYLLSELKVAFLIGFQIFLPFLVIDLVVASILTSIGLNLLPPSLISLPFKLLLFVLIDGWFLTVGMLLESVRLT